MLAEVEKFIEEFDAIKAEINAAYEVYRHETSINDTEYNKRRTTYIELRDGRYDRYKAVAAKLIEITDDKLVRFIVTQYLDEYDSQAIRVLKKLPATLAELDDFAAEQGWCGIWNDAVDRAIEAEALDVDDATRAKRRVRRYLRNEMYENEANRVMELVEEYVEKRIQADRSTRIENALNAPAGVE